MSNRIYRLPLLALLAVLAAPTMAATITVTTTQDVVNPTDGLCSLREAIMSVNTGNYSGNVNGECTKGDGNADTIVLSSGTYLLGIVGADEDNNASGDLDFRASVSIQGAGMDSTIIDASGFGAIPDRVLDLPVTSINFTLRDLTIANGKAPTDNPGESGGGMHVLNANVTLIQVVFRDNRPGNSTVTINGLPGSGAGIFTSGGNLSLVRSRITQNTSDNTGSNGAFGGGIYASYTNVIVNRTRIESNDAGTNGSGGGIFCATGCTLSVSQSSITSNTADGGGGGIYMAGNALYVANSTVAQNASANYGAGLYVLIQSLGQANPQLDFVTIADNHGIGVYFDSTRAAAVNFRNSIVAGNDSDSCYRHIDGNFVTQGYNFSGIGCPVGATDIAFGANEPLRLGPLTHSEDGLTYLMLPHPDSPAINSGSCAASNLFIDQRGHVRPADVPRVNWKFDGCDIGAAELDDDIFWSGLGG